MEEGLLHAWNLGEAGGREILGFDHLEEEGTGVWGEGGVEKGEEEGRKGDGRSV